MTICLDARMPEVPKDVRQVLEQVQFYDREAILVGGFLRDLYCRKTPKDLDIIVQHSTDPEWVANNLKGDNYDCNTIESNRQHSHSINFSFEAKFTVEDCQYPVNLIGACYGQTPMEKLLNHDFGLCRIWYDGKRVYGTEEFVADIKSESFTLLRCRDKYEWEAVQDHFVRLQKKYPWPMRISAEYLKAIIRFSKPDEGGEEIIF